MFNVTPTIFLGPPGTGKTTKMLDTVLIEMEDGVPPDRIGFVTFTKRGAEEATVRAMSKFNVSRATLQYFCTLHSLAFRRIGMTRDRIFDKIRVREFGRLHNYEFRGHISDDGTFSGFVNDDKALFIENYARTTRTDITEAVAQFNGYIDIDRTWSIIRNYKEYKRVEDIYDFTDIIEEFITQNDPPRLDVLFVDEAQDLTEQQWQMVAILARHVQRMYVAGDDDQTIFDWAGASQRFITMPGTVQILQQSHRVPIKVHGLANFISEHIQKRRPKKWNPRPEEGGVFSVENIDRLNLESLDGDIMMLGRTNKMLKKYLIPYCRDKGLPYSHLNVPAIKVETARAITAWNKMNTGEPIALSDASQIYDLLGMDGPHPSHKEQLKRLASSADTDISRQELQKYFGLDLEGTWNEVFTKINQQDVEYINRVIAKGYDLIKKPNINVSTIHRVKGGQAETVVLLSDKPPQADLFTVPDQELRVIYTAVTRTYENLVIIRPHSNKRYYDQLVGF